MRFPIVLLKNDARRGFSGDGCSRKAYRVSSRGSSLPNLSLITPTSHVSSSHAMFGNLKIEVLKKDRCGQRQNTLVKVKQTSGTEVWLLTGCFKRIGHLFDLRHWRRYNLYYRIACK